MSRNMSFKLTTQQIKDGTKTVTRRDGWWNLRRGEIINACVQCQGLKKGEKITVLRQIRIISTQQEQLDHITKEECVKEGFPDLTPAQFVTFFCETHKGMRPTFDINRIEFEYIN